MTKNEEETSLVILSEVEHDNDFQQTVPTDEQILQHTHTQNFTYNPPRLQNVSIFSTPSTGKYYITHKQNTNDL